jgi:HEAT repeat protein
MNVRWRARLARRYFIGVMDHSVTFARYFARLVHLLLNEPENVEQQKGSLRALVTLARDGGVVIGAPGGELAANGASIPSMLEGVSELSSRITAYGLHHIEVEAGATAGDLLGAARLLAGIAATTARLPARATVRFVADEEALPAEGVPELELAPAPQRVPPAIADLDFDLIEEEPALTSEEAAASAPPLDPRSLPTPDLLSQLDRADGVDLLTRTLDELAARAEDASRDGDPALAAQILSRVVRRERGLTDIEAKRAFFLGVRRLAQPPVLHAVLADLSRLPEKRAERVAVLVRAGEGGVEALVERLAATTGAERDDYLAALRELPAAIPTLVHMLDDSRWFLARNAATLLGELKAHEAERPLGKLLHHDDERVRHAATRALMRLGTPRSMPAIAHALKDVAPQMRVAAAAELVARKQPDGAVQLLHALDDERDDEVRAAFLLALGRLATPEGVARLIAAARPERRIFRKKPVALRVAAVQGLGESRTPEAIDALRRLSDDKEHDVRAAAAYALQRISAPSDPSSG